MGSLFLCLPMESGGPCMCGKSLQLCLTLCNPIDDACQASLSSTVSRVCSNSRLLSPQCHSMEKQTGSSSKGEKKKCPMETGVKRQRRRNRRKRWKKKVEEEEKTEKMQKKRRGSRGDRIFGLTICLGPGLPGPPAIVSPG